MQAYRQGVCGRPGVVFLEHPQQICPEAEGGETGDYITIDGTPPVEACP